MPPAVAPVQTSRAGLITALIVAIIIAVAMTVTTFYGFQKWTEAEKSSNQLTEKYRPLAGLEAASDPRVNALLQLKQDPSSPYASLPTALDVSIAQSEQLAKLVGNDLTPDRAANQARATLTTASGAIKQLSDNHLISFTLPQNVTLASAIDLLTNQLSQVANERQAVQQQLAASEQKLQQAIAAQKSLLDEKDKVIQEANAKAEASAADVQKYQAEAQQAQQQLQQSTTEVQKRLQVTNADLTKQIQAGAKQIADLTKQVAGYKAKLRTARVPTAEAEIQHAKGNIVRLTDNNTVFINIGRNQSVTPGLTFEVYDKGRGIPPLGDGLSDNNLPAGKASIEVFNVGADTSECRVTKLTTGDQIKVGDLIDNLVYDPNTKYNFVVYGDFDLSHGGIPSPGDSEIVKRLITQWGGKLQTQVDVDTDFVVMGKEPQPPVINDPNDPVQQQRAVEFKARDAAYAAVVAKASQLSVPIMNQNRFLYFIGYYDVSAR